MKISITFLVGLLVRLGVAGMAAEPGTAVAAGPEASDLTLRITTCLPKERPVANLEVQFSLTRTDREVIQIVKRTDALGVVTFDGSAAECCDVVHISVGPATRAVNYPFSFTRACGECKMRVGPWDIKTWAFDDCQDLNCCPESDKDTGAWHLRIGSRP
jgi:hypothetical protein